MKILMILSLGLLSGCSPIYFCPDKIALKTGIDFEIQEGMKTKNKPSVCATAEWIFR